MTKTKVEPEEVKEDQEVINVRANRYARFVELLGEDCGYLDALVDAAEIHPYDIKKMQDKGWPDEYIIKVLL
jgi:hypothetical protein